MYENNHLEFKREVNEKLEKEVVAFLNSKDWHIYFEVDDGSETTYEFEDIDKAQLLIRDRIKDKLHHHLLDFLK